MTVLRDPRSPFWRFDFQFCGRRYFGSTKRTGRREAEAIERIARDEVERFGRVVSRWRASSRRYRGLCACAEHAWAVLTRGYVTLVSPEDAYLLESTNWHATSGSYQLMYAARRSESGENIRLHRVILGNPPNDVDHKDHVGINNQRSNLRPATRSQNCGNKRRQKGQASPFRGVSRDGNRWHARIAHRKLGTFPTPEEAARVYDAAALERFAEFATLNFPRRKQ